MLLQEYLLDLYDDWQASLDGLYRSSLLLQIDLIIACQYLNMGFQLNLHAFLYHEDLELMKNYYLQNFHVS